MSSNTEFEAAAKDADKAVVEFDDHDSGWIGRLQHALHVTPALVPLIVLVAALIVFAVLLGSKFFSPFALTLILQQVQIVGVLAAAQTLIILTAGIDLSVGAIAVFCTVIMGQFTFRYGIPAPLAVMAGLAVGTGLGAISGWLVSRVKLPPFIATLGMWQIVLAANYLYSANEMGTKLKIGGATLTLGVVLMVMLVFVLAYMLRSTAWGRHVYAVGDDAEAAELAGVDVHKTLMSVYMLAGFICGLAAWVMIGRFSSVSPSASTGVIGNIQAITAVVIGGISLFGGRGSILGAFFGALIVGVFELGLRMAGADPQWTFMLIGMLIIGAVTVDQWIRKVSIGDNGAGKSTLIKSLCGAVIPDEGEIFLDGTPVSFSSPIDARSRGIETVYQTLAMSPALSIADNMFMGREIRKPGVMGSMLRQLDKKAMEEFAREKLSELGLMTIQNINQSVETLSGGQRQGVAVARAAAFGSKVIILDEPTAALGVKESRRVLELILDVKARGIPIVLISHNMPHVFEVCDRVHVHRLGRRLTVIDPKQYEMSDAVAFMTGAKTPEQDAA